MRRVGGPRYTDLRVGTVVLFVLAFVIYFGITSANPLAGHFELRAAFKDAQGVKANTPVRIAGINVGKVTGVERLEGETGAALVKMHIDDNGLPLHKDARLKIRPRIFLEGNSFIDLAPGSPSAKKLKDGDTVPVTQTAAPVGLGRVLEALQHDTREDLKNVLDEYGRALTQGGAAGYNRSTRYWEPAFRDSAVVNNATLGVLEHDLGNYIRDSGKVAVALDKNPVALKGLISDFATTADALAREQGSLRTAVSLLPSTLRQGHNALRSLDHALPPFRRLVADLRPTVRASGPSLDAQLPFVTNLRGLFTRAEMGSTADRLRAILPSLIELNKGGVTLQKQTRALASCQLNSVIPTANTTIVDPDFPPAGPVYAEGLKWLPGISGESRSFDANGQYIKTSTKGALTLAYPLSDGRFFFTGKPLIGINPPPRQVHSPMRPDVPCETQEAPDLRSKPVPAPTPIRVRQSGAAYEKRLAAAEGKAVSLVRSLVKKEGLSNVLKVVSEPLAKAKIPALRAAAQRARRAVR